MRDYRLRLACLLLALTWGFSLFAYGRAQRISGFETWEACNTQMEKMRAAHPERNLQDCTLDVKPTS